MNLMTNRKKQFTGFLGEFTPYMQKNFSDMCFYGYGSYFNGSENPKDLDGGIIAPNLITNKEKILAISKTLYRLANEYQIPKEKIQFNLLDKVSSEDGRFLSYDTSYTDFIKKSGKILSGKNFLKSLNGVDNKFGILTNESFNFWAMRNNFLKSSFYSEERKKEKITKGLNITYEKLLGLPRKILELRIYAEKGEDKYNESSKLLTNKTKKDALKEISKIFPEKDFSLFYNPPKVEPHHEGEYLCDTWGKIITAYEHTIEAFIEKFPAKKISVETLV